MSPAPHIGENAVVRLWVTPIPSTRDTFRNPKIRLLALSLLASVAAPAFADKLEITGELLTSTCAVQSTGGTITVAMGQVVLASVNTATRAGQKNFSISLDCTGSGASQDVGVRFGDTPDGSTGNLKLTAASTATQVGVALYDASGVQQKIGEDPTQWVTIAANGSGQLDYSAWYASPAIGCYGRHRQCIR